MLEADRVCVRRAEVMDYVAVVYEGVANPSPFWTMLSRSELETGDAIVTARDNRRPGAKCEGSPARCDWHTPRCQWWRAEARRPRTSGVES